MNYKLAARKIVLLLIAAAIVLPIAVCVVLAVGALLSAMGDSPGGGVLRYIAWAFGILWGVDLICLVLAMGVSVLTDPDETEDS